VQAERTTMLITSRVAAWTNRWKNLFFMGLRLLVVKRQSVVMVLPYRCFFVGMMEMDNLEMLFFVNSIALGID
jgi:hypothetical protein